MSETGLKTRKYRGKAERLCEAAVGVDYRGSAPTITRCTNKATWVFCNDSPRCLGALVCDICLPKIQEQYGVKVVKP